jgi:hypothetical protein
VFVDSLCIICDLVVLQQDAERVGKPEPAMIPDIDRANAAVAPGIPATTEQDSRPQAELQDEASKLYLNQLDADMQRNEDVADEKAVHAAVDALDRVCTSHN